MGDRSERARHAGDSCRPALQPHFGIGQHLGSAARWPTFLPQGLGGAAGIIELAGFLIPSTQILGFVPSGLETVFEILFNVRKPAVDAPLHHGRYGILFRTAGLLEGPASLLIRVFWRSAPAGRYTAAVCFLLGALLSRCAWIWAGRTSAQLPETQFALQRSGKTKP